MASSKKAEAAASAYVDHRSDLEHADPIAPKSVRCMCGTVFAVKSAWLNHRWDKVADAVVSA